MQGDGRFVVVWTEKVPGHFRVLARRFDAGGAPLGAPFRLTPNLLGNQREPRRGRWRPTAASSRSGRATTLGVRPPRAGDLRPPVLGRQGRPLRPRVPGQRRDPREQIVPRVESAADGDFVVVWDSYGGESSFYDVRIQRYARRTARRRARRSRWTPARPSRRARSLRRGRHGARRRLQGRLHRLRRRLRARRFELHHRPAGAALHRRRHPGGGRPRQRRGRGDPTSPDVSRRAGGFFAVWESQSQFAGHDDWDVWIFGRRLAEDGTPIGPDILISAERPQQRFPVVALNAAGRGVVAWNDYDPTLKTFRVLARRIVQKLGG